MLGMHMNQGCGVPRSRTLLNHEQPAVRMFMQDSQVDRGLLIICGIRWRQLGFLHKIFGRKMRVKLAIGEEQ